MKYKKNFPLLSKKITYLDSAATTQKPKSVIKAIEDYYKSDNANPHRSFYGLGENATRIYEDSRKIIANFINSSPEEIIFTKGATESANMLALMIKKIIPSFKNEIVVSVSEHNSNILPWISFAKRYNFKVRFIPLDRNFNLDYKIAQKLINKKTAFVSICSTSNFLGIKNNISLISNLTKKHSAYLIVDAAQSVSRNKIDVLKMGCDFLFFSSHKVYGPMGFGVLYGKKKLLEIMNPAYFGGGIVNSINPLKFKEIPYRFEAGTPNLEGAVGLKAAIEFIESIGIDKIEKYEKELFDYAYSKLSKLNGLEIYSNSSGSSIISFNIKGIHHHDVSALLAQDGICVRAGNHCNHNLMQFLNIKGAVRVSFGIYNDKTDVDKLVKSLDKIIRRFSL